jgi:hypothetical protein
MQGTTALAGLALLHSPLLVHAFPRRPGELVRDCQRQVAQAH